MKNGTGLFLITFEMHLNIFKLLYLIASSALLINRLCNVLLISNLANYFITISIIANYKTIDFRMTYCAD